MTSGSGHKLLLVPRFVTISAILVSILQGSFFTLGAPQTTYSALAIGLSAANLLIALRYLSTNSHRTLRLAFALYCIQFVIFAVTVGLEPHLSFRLLQIAIALTYLAAVLSVLLSSVRIMAPGNAILLSVSVLAGFFLCETALELQAPSQNITSAQQGLEWSGAALKSHPALGAIYIPYSEMRTYYPDNPRSYFKEEDAENRKWELRLLSGNLV